MTPSDAIRARRSIRRFTPRPITKADLEPILEVATNAPNHHLTNPWRFYVLGPEARHAYGLVLGGRKAKKIEDAEKAAAMRTTVADEHRALPCMLAVAMVQSDNPETREEDYAATMMAVQNIALAAIEHGLGTSIKSGAIMADPAARAAVGVAENERIVAVVNIGEPAELPPAKARADVATVTFWRD